MSTKEYLVSMPRIRDRRTVSGCMGVISSYYDLRLRLGRPPLFVAGWPLLVRAA